MIEKPKRKVPKIIPYRRGKIFTDSYIRGTDKFLLMAHDIGDYSEERYLNIASVVGRYDEASSLCEQYRIESASKFSWTLTPPWTPRGGGGPVELIRAYLYENSANSFGLCNNASFKLLLAFRSKKDYFKYSLMFGDTQRLKMWPSNACFWLFIDEKDSIPYSPTPANDWNNSDPKGGWL